MPRTNTSDRLEEIRTRGEGWSQEFARTAPLGPLEEDLSQAAEDIDWLLSLIEELERA